MLKRTVVTQASGTQDECPVIQALGSVFTNAWSDSAADLLSYGSFVGMAMSAGLIWVSYWQGAQFDSLIATGTLVGDDPAEPKAVDHPHDDTSCGEADEGQTTTAKTEIAV